MSKDIRSFFMPKGSTQKQNDVKEKPRKRAPAINLSDDEDSKNSSPLKNKHSKVVANDKKAKDSHSKSRMKKRVISSDEEEEDTNHSKNKKAKFLDSNKKDCYEEKLVELNEDPATLLRKNSAGKSKSSKVSKKSTQESNKKSVTNCTDEFMNEDDEFDATLNQLDTSQFEEEYLASLKTDTASPFFKSKENDASNSQKKEKEHSKNKSEVKKQKKADAVDTEEDQISPSKNKKENKDHAKDNHEKEKKKDSNDKKSKKDKDSREHNSSNETKSTDYNDVIEEKIEKKKSAAILYQKYLHRGGARNPGSKEVPQAAENCLANLSFLITGVLDSLEREEAEGIIKQYGGKIIHSVSRKLSYIIVGDEPGPSKLTKAESLGIKKLSEDDFLDLLRSKPAAENNAKSSTTSNSNIKRKRDDTSSDRHQSPEKTKKNKEEPTEKVKQESPKKSKKNQEETTLKVKQESPEKPKINNEKPSLKDKQNSSPNAKQIKDSSPKAEIKKTNTDSSKNNSNKLNSPIKNKLQSNQESDKSRPSTSTIKNETNNLKYDVDHITALVEKYRPKEMKQIIGQTGDKSNANKLHNWLKNWHNIHGKNSKAPKPKSSYRDDTGSIYKAALLSGPPGIGKTTTAYVVCAQLGYEVLEFNASDTRSKKLLQGEISGIISNRTVKSFMDRTSTKKTDSPKHVLLMDEVDGMAGNEDRGGMQELISFIKSTEIPIICICNDRQSPKIRTLSNYTFDLRFQKPRLEQIRAAMMSLCYKEGIKVDPNELTLIIQSTNQDIRQVINHIAVLSAKSQTPGGEKTVSKEKLHCKNLKLGPWDVVRKVFSAEEHKNMSIHDKSDLFFHDYNIAPLFVEENYLIVTPSGPKNQLFDKIAECSESLSIGDTVEKQIRNSQAWSLLPVQACFSSVIPGSVMSGFVNSQINFPSWLGRNSKTNKCDRLLQDITVHARITTGASKEAINLDYIKLLVDSIVRPLALEGSEGVEKAIDVMNKYHLTRDDLDSLIELTKWPHTRDLMQSVDSKTKAAFTKAYNKTALFAGGTTMKKKASRDVQDDDYGESEQEQSDDDEDNEKIENDKLVKAKASKAKTAGGSETKLKETKSKAKKPAKTTARSKK